MSDLFGELPARADYGRVARLLCPGSLGNGKFLVDFKQKYGSFIRLNTLSLILILLF
jgi:hypothetical protein